MESSSSSISGIYDVVVVGAGIMGSCAAYEVAKKGRSVLLLEQFDFLHRRGSSHGESRTIRLTYHENYYTLMAQQALEMWKQAQSDAGYEVYTRTGQLDFGRSTNRGLQQVIAACKQFGLTYELLTGAQAGEKFGMLEFPEDCIAVHTHDAGVLHATKAVAMFQSLATKHGATLRDRAKVSQISSGWKTSSNESGVLVATNKGSVLAKKCIITTGAWTSKLVKDISGLELPIQPLHTFHAYWEIVGEAADAFLAKSGFPCFACYDDQHIFGTPSLEYPGLIKISTHEGFPCDPDNRSLAPNCDSLGKIAGSFVASTFKKNVKSEAPVIAEGCMYSMTPDHDFIIDFLPDSDKEIVVASGFSGHGFKMAPLVGRIMAELALNGACEGVPLEYFSLSRFVTQNCYENKKDFDPVQELKDLNLRK